MRSGCLFLIFALGLAAAGCRSDTTPSGPPVLLTANIVDPESVDAVSMFNSCSGHPFPENTSPNSAKNYFWPNSTNFSTVGQLQEFAACDGTIGQNSDDTNPNEMDRGQTVHLYCDKSSTSLRYFHLVFAAGLIGQHVSAGALIGAASMVGTGQTPSVTWQNSSNFDVAVIDGTDDRTTNYFSKLDGPTFAAWSARGITSVVRTINPGNPTCASFLSGVGSPDVVSLAPIR
jgi:hypothetical protein